MARILVTGGNGFLGQSLLSLLLKETQHDVYTISRSEFNYFQHFRCDLLNVDDLMQVLLRVKPEIIFHLAANPNAKPDKNNPSAIIRDNIEGTNNLIVYSQDICECPRFIHASSVTVYGHYNKKDPPYWMTCPEPISVYATTKLACDSLVTTYTKQGLIKGTSIRIPALTGVNATHGLVKDLIAKISSSSEKIEVYGNSPGSIKPFIDVDECAKWFYNIATDEKFDVGLKCILGTKDSLSVLEIVKIIMDELGVKKNIVWNPNLTWKGDNPEIYIQPCYQTRLNSEQSIRKTVREYKAMSK